jgi:RNA recognition motif-containing protein
LNIHMGNLSRDVTEDQLRETFEKFGNVVAVRLIMDRHSGASKGFGFVEMGDQAEGQAAIDGLNGKELAGRTMDLSEARPFGKKTSRPQGGGGGGRPGRGHASGGGSRKRRSF